MITGHDLKRIYGKGASEVRALDGVSFEIQKGEFIGVTGPSGSGKSTLLHMMGLLDRPTSGTITIDGKDVGTLDERARTQFRLRRLGYVFQDYALVPELTAWENVYLPSMARGMQARECSLVCTDILGLVASGTGSTISPPRCRGRTAAGGHSPGTGQPAGHPACRRTLRKPGLPELGRLSSISSSVLTVTSARPSSWSPMRSGTPVTSTGPSS